MLGTLRATFHRRLQNSTRSPESTRRTIVPISERVSCLLLRLPAVNLCSASGLNIALHLNSEEMVTLVLLGLVALAKGMLPLPSTNSCKSA